MCFIRYGERSFPPLLYTGYLYGVKVWVETVPVRRTSTLHGRPIPLLRPSTLLGRNYLLSTGTKTTGSSSGPRGPTVPTVPPRSTPSLRPVVRGESVRGEVVGPTDPRARYGWARPRSRSRTTLLYDDMIDYLSSLN